MLKIRKANKRDVCTSIEIAKTLKEWFTKEGVKNMKADFELNNLLVAVEKNRVLGFLCYSSHEGLIKGLWMGVRKEEQGKGVGTTLFKWLIKQSKKKGFRGIELKTLTDKDNYPPYVKTRDFYYKLGFKKVGYEKARVKGWDDQIIMEKKLD